MSPADLVLIALLGLPLVAAISPGFLARALANGGGNVWLVLLVASMVLWLYFIRTGTP